MTTEQKLIKNKLGLLDLAAYLQNVSEACRVMGYSRDTFYRVRKAYEEGGLEALKEKNRRKPNVRNRVPEETEQAVVALAWRTLRWVRSGLRTNCVSARSSCRRPGSAACGCGMGWRPSRSAWCGWSGRWPRRDRS